MKGFLHDENVSFQNVLPNSHSRNIAERAIITLKNHLITITTGTYSNFSIKMSRELILQAWITLNSLTPCRLNPRMSACTSLESEFSCDMTLLVHLWSNIITLTTLNQRKLWAQHGKQAWVIVIATSNYQCLTFCAPDTNFIVTTNTFKWSEDNHFSLPKITAEE